MNTHYDSHTINTRKAHSNGIKAIKYCHHLFSLKPGMLFFPPEAE